MSPDSLQRAAPSADERMLEDVRAGLASDQKELAPTYFYDATGSELFEQITRLPEYYLTRVERALLEREAESIVLAAEARSFAELGAGNADKSRILIRAARAHGLGDTYVPVDVDAATLAAAAARVRADVPGLRVLPVVADLRDPVPFPPVISRPMLCGFLGSTIGNFPPAEARELLASLRRSLGHDGRLLLGVDLVKDPAILERAYNDSAGITAAFNLNVLKVLNRKLGADFDPAMFEHRAFYDPRLSRIEMHLISSARQCVTVPGIGEIELAQGETIRTEISRKYDRGTVEEMLAGSGFALERWIPDQAQQFALVLARPERA